MNIVFGICFSIIGVLFLCLGIINYYLGAEYKVNFNEKWKDRYIIGTANFILAFLLFVMAVANWMVVV